MAQLRFSLVTPERELASENVDQVDVPGTEGMFGVLPNHAPFMTALAPGVVRIKRGDKEIRIFVRGGFAEVTPEGLTVLAEEAISVADLNAEKLIARMKAAEADLADPDAAPDTRARAQAELAQLKELHAAL